MEIRNLLDEDWIRSLTESDFTKAPNDRVYYIDVSGRLPKSYLFTKGFLVGDKVNIQVFLSDTPGNGSAGHCALFVGQNGTPASYGYDASKYDTMVLNFYVESITFDMVLAAIKNYKFMVTSAAEIDEYRPYIGENNGLIKLESQGKNLVNANSNIVDNKNSTIEIMNNGQNIIVRQSNAAQASRSMLPIKYEVGKTYTLYCKAYHDEITGAGGRTYIAIRDPSGLKPDIVAKLIPILKSEIMLTFTPTEEGLVLWLYVQSESGVSQRVLYIEDLMVVEGEKTLQEMQALKFQPYYQQITWIPLREPLRGLPDGRADTIDRDGNVIQYIDCSGVEQYSIAQESAQIFEGNLFKTSFKNGNYVGIAKKDNGVYCNIMKFKQTASLQYGVSASPLYGVIYFNLKGKLSENTVDLARKFLNDNNAVFYFTLRTPITYQIPAIYIETYEPVTNVRCMNEVKPSTMGLDYKLAISSLIKRLEALETTAVQEVTRNV